MPHRLYYTQPSLREFDAVVVSSGEIDGRPFVVLDRTAFYPTSGGQPFDTGTLNSVRVVDVVERDDHAVLHVLERPVDGRVSAPSEAALRTEGAPVHGIIDWERRFDHMQQHSGQHVLSAAFERLYHARTVGFHLGAAVSTVDLSAELTADAIERAEEDASRIVWEDRPVTVRFASPEEAAALPLRKEPEREGTLRLIDVSNYDLSACGGTHVGRTGEIGAIQVLSSERLRGGVRLEFVCGGRAMRSFRRLRDVVAGCIRAISVLPEELPAALERIQSDNKDLRKVIRAQQEQLARHEAVALAERAIQVGERFLAVESIPRADARILKAMAASVSARAGHDAALFSSEAPFLVVIARSPGAALDAGTVLRRLIERFGGKGGGRGEMAQGGGLTGDRGEILDEARRLLSGK